MSDYRVDRSLLDGKSTDEIMRILRDERDDYTDEAIEILEEILRSRGIADSEVILIESAAESRTALKNKVTGNIDIKSPKDAVKVLNQILNRLLDGSMEPEVGQACVNTILAILKSLEQEFMSESGEE